MNLKGLTDKVRQTIEARGGTDRLKHDADRLKDIATGQGSVKEKAKAAGEALKQPAPTPPNTPAGGAAGTNPPSDASRPSV